ncbi:MAG: serine/threonine protein kinase [Verrucomicrobia bacterium]|nr:MAG: serine/threonine protein kinase [Verrucomicrobiota bacterium]
MSDKPLKMVTCPNCEAKVFIPGDLPPLAVEQCKRCGHSIMMPMQMRQFELRSKIASGGQGKVYRAFDTVLERLVAVKLMRKELESDPVALDSFIREARACASLNHTNIIHIYSFDELDGQRYLVMELADRGSLDSRIDHNKRLSELEVLDIGTKIASALALALKHGLLHRDIKPGNILFDADNEPKLIDFGLARSVEAVPESTTVTEGTPYYVAPEKIKREKETFLSDMYSLGCTLYHAVTGHVPFEAPSVEELVAAHVQIQLTPPNQVNPEITQPTSDALVQVMAKNPADRFLSYEEFRIALEAARGQLLRMQYTQPPPGSKGGKSKTSWWRR